jgi:tripartite-type tricarboxylate transporter receptor subunit TctC
MHAPLLARRTFARVAFTAAVLAVAPPAALAQATRVVVPGPPGGYADIVVRLASEPLQHSLGNPVVIEHRPGAGGVVGLEFLKNARPDGATVGMINLSAAANETLVKGKSYALLADFEPLGQYAWLANVLIVNPALGADSVAALLETLRKQGQASYSSGGVGSPGHLTGELFKARTGLALTHVPYKGAPPAVTAVMSGEVALMFATASAAIGQVRGGRLRALAVTTAERIGQLPDVPTLAEAGLGGINVTDWVGLVAPKGTPPEARERIHRAFAGAFADPGAQEKLRGATILPLARPLDGRAFGAFLQSEVEKWGKVVREAGIAQ